MDSLLPQVAADLHTTVGAAAMVVTAYAITHGSIQLIIGPVGDRFGKYRTVAFACVIGTILVAVCGMVSTLPQLALARLATGAAAGWVIPISMAYVGDVTPPDRLQPILARYLSGQILGQLFGQAAGGVLGDLMGWRNVYFVLAGMFALAAAGLVFELAVNPQTRKSSQTTPRLGLIADYAVVLSNPFARIVILAAFLEGALAWGAFAYIGADLHLRFGLTYTLVGLTVGCFGIGGLIYAGLVKILVRRLGQIGLAVGGSLILALAYVTLAGSPGLVAGAARDHRDRARLLHAAQHAADQRHADDTGSARHCGRAVLVGALYRADCGRRARRAGHRPRRRHSALSRHRRRAPSAGAVVCRRAETTATRAVVSDESHGATRTHFARGNRLHAGAGPVFGWTRDRKDFAHVLGPHLTESRGVAR